MIEYSIGVCYGIILSDETRLEIEECISDEDLQDEFHDCYLRQLNSWTGGDWFLGITNDFEPPVINLRNVRWDKADVEELEMKLAEYGINKKIDWLPQKYVIQFCY